MNIGRTKTSRNRCILEPLEQAVVKLLVRIKLALQEIVLDQELAQCSHVGLFFGYRRREQLFPTEGRDEIVLQPLDDSPSFCVDKRLNFIHLASKPLDFRMFRPVLLEGVNVLRLQIGKLFFEPLQEVILSNKSHLRSIRFHEFIERFLLRSEEHTSELQ